MTDRLPLARHTKASLDQLYAETDRLTAELADYDQRAEHLATQLARVTDLYERWVKAGPPIGISMTGYFEWWRGLLADLHEATHTHAEQPERTTPDNSPTSSDEPDDLTGAWTPAPPIGCLTVGAEPDPFGYEERERTGRNAGLTLTPAEERLAQFGVDTPGCDCGHDGMGASWHGDDCPWRCSVVDIHYERTPFQRPGLRDDIARAIHRYDRDHLLSRNGIPSKHHRGEADAVLALLCREWPWLRTTAEERDQHAATLAAITAEAARRGTVSIDGIRNIVKEQQR